METKEPTLADISRDLGLLTQGFDHFVDVEFRDLKQKVDPIIDAYDSVIFGKKFLVGLSTVIGSIAAIGAAIIWLFSHFNN